MVTTLDFVALAFDLSLWAYRLIGQSVPAFFR